MPYNLEDRTFVSESEEQGLNLCSCMWIEREIHFQQSIRDRQNPGRLWQGTSGVTAMNVKRQKKLLFSLCLGAGEYRSLAYAFATSSFRQLAQYTGFSDPHHTGRGGRGCVTHGCWFYTREKVSKAGIARRSGPFFVERLNIELQLNTSRRLEQRAGHSVSVPCVYTPAVYLGFI